MRQLLDSLSKEQRANQELLVSIGFALRSFTNLNRFLELVPVVAARLVGVDGALLVCIKVLKTPTFGAAMTTVAAATACAALEFCRSLRRVYSIA